MYNYLFKVRYPYRIYLLINKKTSLTSSNKKVTSVEIYYKDNKIIYKIKVKCNIKG